MRRVLTAAIGAALAVVALALPGAASAASAPNCGARGPCLGIDVSNRNGHLSLAQWQTWHRQGKTFAYIKATEGTYFVDGDFGANVSNSLRAGFIRGAYEFGNPRQSGGTAEADFFLAHGGGWRNDGHTLPGTLDIETGTTLGFPECWGLSGSAIVAYVRAFANEYHAKTTRWPVIYFNAAFWRDCTGSNTSFAHQSPLWVANVGVSSPSHPGWPSWTFWQYGQSGLDLDKFNGNGGALLALAT